LVFGRSFGWKICFRFLLTFSQDISTWNQLKSGLDVTKIVKIYVKICGILKSATGSTFTQKNMRENSETTVSFSRKHSAIILMVNNQRVLTTKPLKDVVQGLLMNIYGHITWTDPI
jgi:hypothetical protein